MIRLLVDGATGGRSSALEHAIIMQKVLRNSTVLMNTHAQKHVTTGYRISYTGSSDSEGVDGGNRNSHTLAHHQHPLFYLSQLEMMTHVLVCVWELRVCYDSVPLL